ncbi:NAD(P)-dependent alcohol dehydrogenase [Microbacterium sediminicola]|uniref:NAD(P)-dependent alcohol dehydrogenase n=1 Tax=Microbacterium sediminicola TaxID=415210 RepID=A0ABN2IF35_9MICO
MKALQFTTTGEPLVVTELPVPEPGPGQVLLRMKAAGLCHTDVGVLEDEGWLELLVKTPITIGHENAGEVAAVGDGVTDWKVGDRVAVCPTTAAGAPGFSFDGGFAEMMLVDEQTLLPIPDGVDWVLGAAATDAGMTSYAAVMTRGGVKAGDTVGIIGLGGLGQIGARVAVLEGATVYAAEVNEAAWHLADELGLAGVQKSIADFPDVVFDVIIDFAGFGTTTAQAVDVIRRDGTVVVVGMGKLESTISTRSLILNQCILKGSNGGTKEDIAGVYRLMATGKLTPVTTTIPFEEIPEGLHRLHDGQVTGRLVAVFD